MCNAWDSDDTSDLLEAMAWGAVGDQTGGRVIDHYSKDVELSPLVGIIILTLCLTALMLSCKDDPIGTTGVIIGAYLSSNARNG